MSNLRSWKSTRPVFVLLVLALCLLAFPVSAAALQGALPQDIDEAVDKTPLPEVEVVDPDGVDPLDKLPPTDELTPDQIAAARKIIIEGDIMTLDPEDAATSLWRQGDPTRQEMPFYGTTWPGGVVPYDFAVGIDPANQTAMRAAMDEWENVADLTFVPRTAEANYLHFIEAGGNWSYIGMIGGSQDLSIYNWNYKYIMCHELAHALGFWHEQSRPDRDTYVTIEWANIQSGYENNFNIQSSASTFGPYDFESIMHYDQYAFSTNWGVLRTITCKAGYTQYQSVIGNRAYMTASDIAGMVAIYGAPALPGTIEVTAPNGGEQWIIGQSGAITWTSSGSVGSSVMIELSLNNGSSWQTLFASTANDGSESWPTVAGPATTQARIRVTDTSNASIYDVGDAVFDIVDNRVAIESTLFLTRASVRIGGVGADSLSLSGLFNDSGLGLGVDTGTTTLTVRDADTPGNFWMLSIPDVAWENSGTRWSCKDSVLGIAVTVDERKHTFRMKASKQTFPFGSAITLEFVAAFPGLGGSQTWPLLEGFRAGRSQPLEGVFIVRKAAVKRGKTPGTDSLKVDGYFYPSGGHDDPSSDPLDLDLDSLWADTLTGGALLFNGKVYSYKEKVASGLTSVLIDANSGRFTFQARNIDLSGLTNSLELSLGLGDELGTATIVLEGDPAVGLKY